MFSPERNNFLLLSNEKSYSNNSLSWKEIFKELIFILYFKDHLNKHLLENFKLTILIGQTLNLETLNLLVLLEKKYPFLTLRQLNSNNILKDIEYNLITNSANNTLNLNSSNLCLLIGINSRLESSTLNLKLRQRYLKGNFQIFSLNSFIDLTFPVKNLGSNLKIFKNIIEGNHFFCQELKKAKNITIIYNSTLFSRNDAAQLNLFFNFLNNVLKIYNNSWIGINCINSTINEFGLNSLGIIKSFTKNDFIDSSGIYVIEANLYSPNILKLIELKLLNYFKKEFFINKYFIEQNNIYNFKLLNTTFNKKFNVSTYIGLPSTTFFEDSGTYLNTEGNFKKTIKIIPSLKNTKSSWQIIRRLFLNLDQNIFFSNQKTIKLIYNSKNYLNFVHYINFHVFAISNLKSSNHIFMNNKSKKIISPKKYYKQCFNKKLFKTKTILWLDDFYIGGKDSYSKFSKIMIECSKFTRLNSTNFKYLF